MPQDDIQAGRETLRGNRLVLIGTALYLLEWVAIIAAGVAVPVGPDQSASDLSSAYEGRADALGWAAGWFSVTLLGRILLIVGVRASLRDSNRPQRLMDLAVAAMAVGVSVEIATYGLAAGASWAVDEGADPADLRILDSALLALNQMLFGPTGVAVLCAGLAMLASKLFHPGLCWLGIVSGAALTAAVRSSSPRHSSRCSSRCRSQSPSLGSG